MRLWSLHPKYLDVRGLVALWREGLLARAVLQGKTRGYKHHPQLNRFKSHAHPASAISLYLHFVCDEAERRGYRFDRTKLGPRKSATKGKVTRGQLEFELKHLKTKLARRDRHAYLMLGQVKVPRPNPMFRSVPGGVETWEKRWEV